MKKVLILLLASIFIFAACSNGNSKPEEPEQTPASTTTTTGTENSGTEGSGGEEGNNQGGETTGTRPEVSGKIGKYESPYEVGDIVFNDGSAMPFTENLTLTQEQKDSAIAIIFFKGTDLNNGDDTTTCRTLGVGLKHSSEPLAWCKYTDNRWYNNAQAYYIEITTIGEDDIKNGSENLERIGAFLSTYEDTYGDFYLEGIPYSVSDDTAEESNYPAFYFAKNYNTIATNLGTTYSSGWYFPSYAELLYLFFKNKNFDIDAASNLCGGDQFGTKWYGASSQFIMMDSKVWKFTFGKGSSCDKKDANYVCAIREFN